HEELPAPGAAVASAADAGRQLTPVTSSTPSSGAVVEPSQARELPASAARFTRKAVRRMRELGLEAEDFPGEARVEVEDVEQRARDLAESADETEVAHSRPDGENGRRLKLGALAAVP